MKIISVLLHRLFEKDYKKQNSGVQSAFRERRDVLLRNPYDSSLNNHPLHGEWKNHWSINVTGNIRAIYRMERSTAVFMAIGTHSELYE